MRFNMHTLNTCAGVTRSSYTAVPLPAAEVCTVRVSKAGKPSDVMEVTACSLPPALEWGCVLVEWRLVRVCLHVHVRVLVEWRCL